MMDEEKQDQIIAHILGSLEAAGARDLDGELAGDAELAAFADELREATASLAHAAPLRLPPPQLRAQVLASARGEAPARAAKAGRGSAPFTSWLPWAVAAGIAVAAVVQFRDKEHFRSEAARLAAEAEAGKNAATGLRDRNATLEAEARSLASQTATLQQELADSKQRDALTSVRIASLNAQVAAYSKAVAVIVWDAERQRGVVKLTNLPKPGADKDFQLWVIDPKYPAPVSAGVVVVGADGSGLVTFSPDQPITTPDKFAISVERTGGAPAPAGPIIFIGD